MDFYAVPPVNYPEKQYEGEGLGTLISNLRGVVAVLFSSISLGVLFLGFLPGAIAKLLVPHAGFRRACTRYMLFFARGFCVAMNISARHIGGQRIVIEDSVPDDRHGRYLLISNHQCWADIPLLANSIMHKLPFPRWFIKQQMIWVPIIGFAAWAMDFPFMQRYTKEQIRKNPSLRGKDMQTTKQACQIYRYQSVTVVNYAEGTRATPAKRFNRNSPYHFCLRPKAGGTAFMLEAMGDVLDGIIDMTVAYVGAADPSAWDYFCGRIPEVRVRLRPLELPAHLQHGSYENDPEYQARFQTWINGLWAEKDAEIAKIHNSFKENA